MLCLNTFENRLLIEANLLPGCRTEVSQNIAWLDQLHYLSNYLHLYFKLLTNTRSSSLLSSTDNYFLLSKFSIEKLVCRGLTRKLCGNLQSSQSVGLAIFFKTKSDDRLSARKLVVDRPERSVSLEKRNVTKREGPC